MPTTLNGDIGRWVIRGKKGANETKHLYEGAGGTLRYCK